MPESKKISGTIDDVAMKRTSRDGKYAEVKLLVSGNTYPLTLRCFDEPLVERLENARRGMETGFLIEERDGEYQGKAITYRNIVGIVSSATEPLSDAAKAVIDDGLFPPVGGEAPPISRPLTSWRPPVASQATTDPRGAGMAWGNSVNAAAASLAAYLVYSGSMPDDEAQAAIADAIIHIATKVYEGRAV